MATSASATNSTNKTRTLIIVLVAVLVSVVILVTGVTVIIIRRRRRIPFLNRGISPIDDEEIESWKIPGNGTRPVNNGAGTSVAGTTVAGDDEDSSDEEKRMGDMTVPAVPEIPGPRHIVSPERLQNTSTPLAVPRLARKKTSASSLVNTLPSIPQEPATPPTDSFLVPSSPPTRIVYAESPPPPSPDHFAVSSSPSTPIQARAPNSRVGLTDESIRGSAPYIASPKKPAAARLRSQTTIGGAITKHRHSRSGSSFSLAAAIPGTPLRNPFSGVSDEVDSPLRSPKGLSHSRSMGNVRKAAKSPVHMRGWSDASLAANSGVEVEEEIALGGLSPRPATGMRDYEEIGRAIG